MSPGAIYRNAPQLPASLVLAGISIGPDNRSLRNDYPTGGKFHDAGSDVKLDWAFGDNGPLAGHTLSAISSYDKYHMDDYQDNDNTDVLPFLPLPNSQSAACAPRARRRKAASASAASCS